MPKLKSDTIYPTLEEEAEINARIAADPEDEELGEEFFNNARQVKETAPEFVVAWEQARREGEIAVRPTGRPRLEKPKRQVTLRLDDEIVEYFRVRGKGWQTRLNMALREYIQSH